MKFLPYLVILFIGLIYESCNCAPCDLDINTIEFMFDVGNGPNQFTPEEVDTVIFYKLKKNANIIEDSAVLVGKPIILNEFGFDFGGKEGPFWENDYRIKTQGPKVIMITDLEIKTKKVGIPCPCQENTVKKLKVDGVLIDLSGLSSSQSQVRLKK
jgi:hypothetical protein